MKKIMMVGKIGCGKTTLSQRMVGETVEYRKTQSIQVIGDDIVDTPGEYLEQKQFYSALMVTAAPADVILLLASAEDEQNPFPPRIHSMFGGKTVIGVVTKTDLAEEQEQIENACAFLKLAGAGDIVKVGLDNKECIRILKDKIEEAETWEDIL